jgi:predicted RNA-binding protein
MCMATAYLKQGSRKEVLLAEVAYVQPEGDSLLLKPLFGEQRCVRATIREIDFLNSTILLEKTEEETK